MSKNLSYLAARKGLENPLFERLLEDAKANGTPTEANKKQLAKDFIVGEANIQGTVSFYDFLKPENQNHKAKVCTGSACRVAGTQEKLKSELAKGLQPEEIGHIVCLGRCHEGGAFQFQGCNYSGLEANRIQEVLATGKGPADKYSVLCTAPSAVLTPTNLGLAGLFEKWGETLRTPRESLLEEIKKSGLRGRGGAGFPVGLKMESCLKSPGRQKFIVCNADEGDPGAYSDRYIMENQPHLLLYGMMIQGYIVGANRGVLYIRGEYPESVSTIRGAIAELEANGLTGENILGSGFDFRFKIIEGAGAYICGEETALLSSIEGQRPEVRVRPPYPTQEGLFNLPTVVNNVETQASLYWIVQNGGEAYAKMGTQKSTGTKLISLDSLFNRPGIVEIEMGTPLLDVIEKHGQGFKVPVKAIQVGGPLGGIVPAQKFGDLTLDFESFAGAGFLMGHAGVVSIPESFPVLEYLEHLFEFTADESCGKCFPCSLGSTRGKELLHKARTEGVPIDEQLMADLLETLEIGSLCALGGGLPIGIKNALQYFSEELSPYFNKGISSP